MGDRAPDAHTDDAQTGERSITVFLADDNVIVREGVRALLALEDDFEIVGVAGVSGNGQSELLEALAGMRPLASGRVRVTGTEIEPGALNPRHMRSLGLLHVPEDRLRAGLVPSFPAHESAMLGFEADKVKALLDLPAHAQIPAIVPIGVAAEEGHPTHRHALERIVSFR